MATVGFRLPDHPVTRELIQAEGPLIGPSANKSGKASGRYFDQIRDQFDFQVTGYQDDDALLGVDSTILDLSVSPAKFSDKEDYKRRPIGGSTRVDHRIND